DLSCLTDSEFRDLESAWKEFAVLVFPAQHLTNGAHLAFGRRFGRLERGIVRSAKKRSSSGLLAYIGNLEKDGTIAHPSSLRVRFNSGNEAWHTDSSYKRVGAKASLLAAHRVPGAGGETEWADMRAAYEALSTDLQDYLADKRAVHSYEYSHAAHGGLELLTDEELADLPPVEHSVIRVHPETGRKNLFVGRHASHIAGEEQAGSRALLKQLTETACEAPRSFKHRWQEGDLVLWDNRCVLHRAHKFPLDQARNMVRVTVAGDDPDNEWAVLEA
ncbi:MAG: TauD/TfdA dioxygenase family protein, partial [Pseudomonadales bacterium]